MGKIFDKLGEIFYLLPYLLIAAVVITAIILILRTIHKAPSNSNSGFTARMVLTVLALAMVAAVWYYFTPEELGEDRYSIWARLIAIVSYLSVLSDIWCGKKAEG